MRAVLRYRRLPHVWRVPSGFFLDAPELKATGKRMIPVMQLPDGTWWADTTPMILALEARHDNGRSVLPVDPAHRFLARLIEDFADEFLVQPLFDYRWNKEADQAFCARRQMAGWLGGMPREKFDEVVAAFRKRQTMLLTLLGDHEINRPLLQATYREVLAAIELLLESQKFLFGMRPSIADFGLFGQLSQMAIDPSASAIMRADAARSFQWVQDLDDASGVEGEWQPAPEIGPAVKQLLAFIGKIYLPYLEANADAAGRKQETFSTQLGDYQFNARVMPYRVLCYRWLKQALSEVAGEPRQRLEAILREHDCWDRLQFTPGEAAEVTPLLPR
jgi:glutathione S-transferase